MFRLLKSPRRCTVLTKSELLTYLQNDKKDTTLEGKTQDELQAIYEERVKSSLLGRKKFLKDFLPAKTSKTDVVELNHENTALIKTIYGELLDGVRKEQDIYPTIKKLIVSLNKKETEDILEQLGQQRWYGHFHKMYRAKLREVEETYIGEIEDIVKTLNEEEKYIILSRLRKKRSNLDFLKEFHAMLADNAKRENFLKLSRFRYLIVNGFLDEYKEEEYRDYYEEYVYKQSVIDEIFSVTKNYTKVELEHKKLNDLKQILEHYRREKEENKKRRQKINTFIAGLKKLIADKADEKSFNKMVGTMFVELEEKDIEYIINILYDASPVFAERIRIVYSENYSKKKNE